MEGGAEGAEAEGGAGLERRREGGRHGRARRGGGAHSEEDGDGVAEVALGGGHADLVSPRERRWRGRRCIGGSGDGHYEERADAVDAAASGEAGCGL